MSGMNHQKVFAGLLLAGVLLMAGSGFVWGMGSRVPAVGTTAEDFWATWCKPCTTEMPAMQAMYDKLRDKGFVVLAINELEDEPKVREHIQQHGHTFPVLMDRDNKVANQFGVFGLPVSVFIDEKGVVQEYIKGGLLTEQVILDTVARIQKPEPMKAASLK